jgi:cysteine synthase
MSDLISASSGDATIGLAMAAKMIGAQLEVQIPFTGHSLVSVCYF